MVGKQARETQTKYGCLITDTAVMIDAHGFGRVRSMDALAIAFVTACTALVSAVARSVVGRLSLVATQLPIHRITRGRAPMIFRYRSSG